MGGSVRALVRAIAAVAVAASFAPGAEAAFRCPAPVPVVGDVRRAQVDRLFFATMTRARAADRLPAQADIDAVLADAGLTARLQPIGYRPLNELLYALAPDGRPGLRIAFFTAETWGYAITQTGTLTAVPEIVDSEVSYRSVGGGLSATEAVFEIVRAARAFGPVDRLPRAPAIVATAIARGLNEGRVQALADAAARPRAGWVGVAVTADRSAAEVRGRSCSRIVTLADRKGVESRVVERRRSLPLTCPANVRVPAPQQRTARALFDAALASALAAARDHPDESDGVAASIASGLAATDISSTPRAAIPVGALGYELGPGRFAVSVRVVGGGLYRLDWLGLDQPLVVTDRNDLRDERRLALGWQLDLLRERATRGRRLPTARSLVALTVAGVAIPRAVLADRRARPRSGTIGIWIASDRRSGVLRGSVCGFGDRRYARTRTGVPA